MIIFGDILDREPLLLFYGIINIYRSNNLKSLWIRWKVIILGEAWFIELAKGAGRLFLNPMLYWAIVLVIITGYKRIQRERFYFGFKIFDIFSEWKNTWFFSIVTGLLISLITIGIGFVFSYEIILLLSIVVIILSLTFKFTMLSVSYTIGITYLLALISPLVLEQPTLIQTNFTSLAILLGLFLMIEALLLVRVKRNDTFPELTLSNRGVWIGEHHLKKLHMIPFFVLIPSGLIEPISNVWPYFSIGEETYSLLLIPFILGFDYTVRGNLAQEASVTIGKYVSLLGLIVLLVAIGSMFLSWLSIIAVMIGIIGKEFINYKHRTMDKDKQPFFNQMDKGLKVLAMIPGSPADRLGILVGETIYRVNGQNISTIEEFYTALQSSGAYFKLEVVDDQQEIRFVQSAFYEGDHHELGLVFTDKPYRELKTV